MENTQNSVTAEFVLKREDGSLIDSSEHSGQLNYIEGLGMMVAGIEKALKGVKENEEFDVRLAPEDMYGLRDETKVMEVSADDFHGSADELEVGTIIEAHTQEGHKLMTVKSIEGKKIMLDSNHPLSGMTMLFSGKVLSSRPATQDEIDRLTKGGCGCGDHGDGESCCGGHEGEDHECCGGEKSGSEEGCGCGCH